MVSTATTSAVRHPADRRRASSDASRNGATEGPPVAHGIVSFRLRRLEPLLAWALAGYTLWVNILLNPPGGAVWWLALLAGSIGAWCRMLPARHQSHLFVRSVLLVVGVFFAASDPWHWRSLV